MMGKVFLLNPPGDFVRTGRLVRKSKIGTQSWSPIFLSYATVLLEKAGYECKLYDASVRGDSYFDTLEIIRKFKPDHIAYYWAYDTFKEDLHYANQLAHFWDVTLVGPWSAHLPNALDYCPKVSAMTFGEFEYTLVSLYGVKSKQLISGLKYRDGGEILFNPQDDPLTTEQLDNIPFVSTVYQNHLNIFDYHQTSFKYPFIDIYSARGCPSRCGFCSVTHGMNQLHPKRWQKRSLRNVMDELWFIKNELTDVKQIFFQDDTLPNAWALEISQAIVDEGLKICWGCYSRADKTYEQIIKLKESGCLTFHVGYECPDAAILSEIQKDISVEQMTKFAKAMEKAKMWQSMSLMIFPWETPEQIKHMIEWAKEMNPTRINVAQLQVYPNTPIVDVVKAYQDIPGKHMMDFEEMKLWEKYCFTEFYLKNPKFWLQVLTNPHEWKSVLRDTIGMLKFLGNGK